VEVLTETIQKVADMCQVKIINDRLLRRYHYQVCQSAWDHARSNSWLYKCHFAV